MKETYHVTYQATAAADVIVSPIPSLLKRIIVGKDVASSVIEISDSKTDGDGDVKLYLEGDTLGGTHEIDCLFGKGITMDLTNQTNVSIIWQPSV